MEHGPPTAVLVMDGFGAILEWGGGSTVYDAKLHDNRDWTLVEHYHRPYDARRGVEVAWDHARSILELGCHLPRALFAERVAHCERLTRALAIVHDQLGVRARLVDVNALVSSAASEIELSERGRPRDDVAYAITRRRDGLGELWELARQRGWDTHQLTLGHDLREHFDGPVPPRVDEHAFRVDGRFALATLREQLGWEVLAPGPPLSVADIDEEVFERPSFDTARAPRKMAIVLRDFFPLRLTHRPTGTSVYVQCGANLEAVRIAGRELLAARVASARVE